MPWQPVINNIITLSELDSRLSSYSNTTTINGQLALKLNASGGVGSGITLTSEAAGNDAVLRKDSIISLVSAEVGTGLSTKLDVTNPQVTGNLTLDLAASADAHALRRSDGDNRYLRQSGGTLSGNVVLSATPTLDTHLISMGYANTNYATLSDLSSLSSTVDTKASSADVASNYLSLTGGGDLTGNIYYLTDLNVGENSQRIATTAFVTSSLSDYDTVKADLNSPNFTGTPQINAVNIATETWTNDAISTAVSTKANIASPTFTGTPSTPAPTAADNSTRIANTSWVRTHVSDSITNAFASPSFGTLQRTGALATSDNSFEVPNTAWVRAYVESVLP